MFNEQEATEHNKLKNSQSLRRAQQTCFHFLPQNRIQHIKPIFMQWRGNIIEKSWNKIIIAHSMPQPPSNKIKIWSGADRGFPWWGEGGVYSLDPPMDMPGVNLHIFLCHIYMTVNRPKPMQPPSDQHQNHSSHTTGFSYHTDLTILP